ncbi:MAG: hypothetical protein PVF58_11805 [Candidatus Methanofastidiosia archaeon]|jgi:hypothetical protein
MKKSGTIIYFGEEMDSSHVKIQNDTVLINGHPLIPSYSIADMEEESEFTLDQKTQKIIKDSLQLLNPHEPFEKNAERVMTYLKEKGLSVRKGEYYNDIYLDTDEGWGVIVLFNEEARIKKEPIPPESFPEKHFNLKELFESGLVIVDKGVLSLIPAEQAAKILKDLQKIYNSQNNIPTKIKKIQNILEIPEESARKLLLQHI